MPSGTRITIKAEWQSVPVLLWDRSTEYLNNGQDTSRGSHEAWLVTMSHFKSSVYLKRIAEHLGWDNLVCRLAETTYTAQHVPLDQVQFLPGADPSKAERSSAALARAGISHGIETQEVSQRLLARPQVAKRMDQINRLRDSISSDTFVASRIAGKTVTE
ncbi:hypothetical protein, partial [Sporisorium scitamineum]